MLCEDDFIQFSFLCTLSSLRSPGFPYIAVNGRCFKLDPFESKNAVNIFVVLVVDLFVFQDKMFDVKTWLYTRSVDKGALTTSFEFWTVAFVLILGEDGRTLSLVDLLYFQLNCEYCSLTAIESMCYRLLGNITSIYCPQWNRFPRRQLAKLHAFFSDNYHEELN